MAHRWLIAGVLATALFTGCKSAPVRHAETWTPPAPDRWERTACRLDQYPEDLDARALARARYEDLRAEHEGAPAPMATERFRRERAAFESRCATWRAESQAESKLARL